ncbi:hypothetical protein [Pseudoalteromonas mariniglutinosa]|uniref:hypothetical protein n=1 Tax=Pseudoalteromonas mariniglutinosa TaxID=206042 RepID=UPI00384F51C8
MVLPQSLSYYSIKRPQQVLAIYYQSPSAINEVVALLPKSALRELAAHGVSAAQWQIALRLLTTNNPQAARLYWQPSFATYSRDQQISLVNALYQQQQWQALTYLAKLGLLPDGEVKQHWLLHQGAAVNQITAQFAQQQQIALSLTEHSADKHCQYNVLMLSDHRQGLMQLKAFKYTYSQKPEPAPNSFCFSTPSYVAEQINCFVTSQGAASCDWLAASKTLRWPTDYDFIVMMPRHGRANVSGGIMHINSASHYNVFLHELMHFSGFEDEYALAESKQQWLCKQQGYVAPNLFIARQLPPPIGWHQSIACDSGVAYQPAKNWSIMRYMQIDLSAQYRTLWQQQINKPLTPHRRYTDYFLDLALAQ